MSDSQTTVIITPRALSSLSDHRDPDAHSAGSPRDEAGGPSDADPVGGNFAILIPRNRKALRAFNDVVMSASPHHQKYLHVKKAEGNSFSDPDSTDNPDITDTDTEPVEVSLPWAGHYCLNMDIPPMRPRLGWTLGSGRSDLTDMGVDLLLTDRRKACRVAGRHVRLVHNLDTGFLLLCTDLNRKVILDGKVEVRNQQRAITSRVTGLTIGDLSYTLEFCNLSTYRDQIRRLKEEMGHSSSTSALNPTITLSPTPSNAAYDIPGYSVQATISKGVSSVVCAGIAELGGAKVVIKKMARTKQDMRLIQEEIDMYRIIHRHPRFCRLLDVHFSAGDLTTVGPNGVDEVCLTLSPLAEHVLSDIITLPVGDETRAVLFKQCCQGVEFLHQRGIMHRDLKPANIAVVTLSPPKAILIDLGTATSKEASRNHMVGTIPYLAPEVMALKDTTSRKPYDKSVDIWSLGLTGFELFSRTQLTWKFVERDGFLAIVRALGEAEWSRAIADLLLYEMVTWRSDSRMSADEVLAHTSLCDIDVGEME